MEQELKKDREWLDKLTLYAIRLLVPCGSSEQLQPCAGSVGIPYRFSSPERMQIAVSDSWKSQPIARGDGTSGCERFSGVRLVPKAAARLLFLFKGISRLACDRTKSCR